MLAMKNTLFKKLMFGCLLILIGATSVKGQDAKPDLVDATILCDKRPMTIMSFNGAGTDDKEADDGCLKDLTETNTTWFTWEAATEGSLAFDIQPTQAGDQFSFSLFQLPNGLSNGIDKVAIRCAIPCGTGTIGLRDGDNDFVIDDCMSAADGFMRSLSMETGLFYGLMIENTTSNGGFTITFSGDGELVGPVGQIIPDNTAVCFGDAINFDGSSITFANGDLEQYNWSFEDGDDITNRVLVTNDPQDFIFQSNGNKRVELTVTTDIGCTSIFETTVTINDCCGSTNQITIEDDPAITEIACPDDTNGAIDITINNASAFPPIYEWSNDETSEDLSMLPPDTYSITVSNAAGCRDSFTHEFIIPNALEAMDLITPPSCRGVSGVPVLDGVITIEASGGRAPYEYDFGDGNGFVTTPTLNGLDTGDYVVIVRDDSGCTKTVDGIELDEKQLNITAGTPVDPSCFEEDNGAIDITVDNAVGVLTFDFNDGNGPLDETSITRLGGGNYTINVFDSEGCTGNTVDFTLTEPDQITSIIDSRPGITCNGANDGTAIVTATGGVPDYTYEWSTGSTDRSIANLGPGLYTVVITDDNGCTDTAMTAPLLDPDILTATLATINDVSCSDKTDGSMTLDINGGTMPYKYTTDGINFENGSTLSDLAIGDYTITVTDNNDCPVEVSGTISSPATLSFTTSPTTDICYGEPLTLTNTSTFTQGNITSVSWNFGDVDVTGENVNTSFTTIGKPIIELVVMTDLDCTERLIQELDISVLPCCNGENGILAFPDPVDPLCNGGSSGSIDLNINSLPPLASIDWEDGNTEENRSNLSAGNYTVTITNDATCEAELPITLGEPSLIIPTLTITEPTCDVAANGEIMIAASGGTIADVSNYNFNLNDGNGFNFNNVRTDLLIGNYSNIRVRDDNNCTVSIDTFLAVPAGFNPITASLNIMPPTCDEATNGVITVTATGDGRPLFYDFGNGPSTDNILNNVEIGFQSIVIQDLDLCRRMIDTIIVAADILPFQASAQINQPSCEEAANGIITIIASGNNSPLEYDFGNGFVDDNIAPDLAIGNYQLVIRDRDNCTFNIDTALAVEPDAMPIQANLQINQPSCSEATNGAITILASGNGGPFEYDFDGGGFADENGFMDLAIGNYAIIVRDADNCTLNIDTALAVLPDAMPIQANLQINQPSCSEATNGAITILASGNGGPFEYDFDGGGFIDENSFMDLTIGNYAITIRDADNCTFNINTSLAVAPGAMPVQATLQIVEPSCGGATDGSITVLPSGELGTDITNYEYDFGNGFLDNNVLDNLGNGQFFAVIRNRNNCFIALDTFLNELVLTPDLPLVVRPTCFGLSDGSIVIEVPAPGEGPFTYNLDDGNGFQDETALTNLPQGTYTVQVQDDNLCLSEPLDIVVDQPDELMLSLEKTDISCFGENDGSIVATVTGGVNNYSYTWSNGQVNNAATSLMAGDYTLDVRDGNDCPISSQNAVTIIEPAELSATIGQIDNALCFGEMNGAFTVNPMGGSAPYEYSLDGIIFQPTATFGNLFAGDYSVIVKDNRNCEITTQDATVDEPGAFTVDALVDNATTKLGFTINLSAEANTTATGSINYTWSIPDSIVCTNCERFETVPPGSTTYTVNAVNSDNCQASASVSVAVSTDRPIYFPNIFTPNGDGVHDEFFIPFSPAMEEIKELKIFDRTGALVFEAFNIKRGEEIIKSWDGEFNGTELRQGVYVVIAEILFVDKQTLPYQSDVTIITSQ